MRISFALVASFFLALAMPAFAGDPVVDFAPDDPEMGEAIGEARATLDQFLANGFDGAGRGLESASFKVAFPVDGGGVTREHIWVGDLALDGDGFTGRLANEPNFMPGLSLGSPVSFDRTMISDWGIFGGGKLHGHYTTRIVVTRMSAAQAAQYKALLAANPVPQGW